jgi:hypothetical protein
MAQQKINYDVLDAAIIAAITNGKHRFININTDSAVDDEVRELALERDKNRKHGKSVDARLQSLRNQGKIEFAADIGWRLSKPSHTASE